MNKIFIISGPAGSGKDTIIDGLSATLSLERIVTSTTRPMRPGESEGRPYHFLSHKEFEDKIARQEFVEYSTNENDELYGVTRDELQRVAQADRLALWKVDWKGVMNIKKLYPHIKAIFITAPITVLDNRLRRRDGTAQDEQYFIERKHYTEEWLRHTDIYDYIIENEEGKIDEAIEKVRQIVAHTE